MTRLKRVVRHRLALLVALVLLGTTGAIFLVNTMNDGIRPTFEAVASASMPEAETTEVGSGRASSEIPPSLTEALETAIEANEGFIDPKHMVRAAPATQSIQFIVLGRTPEEATADAAEMRDRYLEATAPAPIEERMQDVLSKAHTVREQLNTLLPEDEAIPADPLVAAQRALLNGQISSLTSESAQLSVEQVLADTDAEKEAIQEDIDRILAQLVDLRTQLAALPLDSSEAIAGRGSTEESAGSGNRGSDPVVVDSNDALDDQFQIESLQSLYSNLQIEFQMLYIESTDNGPPPPSDIDVTDETPDPIAIPVAAGVGVFGFTLLGLGLVMADDRLKRKWWTQNDFKGVLAETPDRGIREPRWYWSTTPGPRKMAIQKVAVNFLHGVEGGPVAVGVVGVATEPATLRVFSVDLAASIVTARRTSLVIDTTGLEEEVDADPWNLLGDGPVVADLFNPWKDDIDDDQITRAVLEARELWPGLGVIPSGGPSLYSIEGAMTPVASKLLDKARKSFDLTLVSITEKGTALSDALVRNLDAVLIVGRSGKTKISDVERLTERLTASGITVLGSVLILKPSARGLRDLFKRRRPGAQPEPSSTNPEETTSVGPIARTGARHAIFARNGSSVMPDKVGSISHTWDTGEIGRDEEGAVEVGAAVIENGADSQPDISSQTGNGGRPKLRAVLASHPDARPRSDT
ncbi:MAG TPA: hypothetical protein VJQ79_04125 [Acidimicrobiia bacterium]|nr:hypothetical protein [Acidimicrobiia bacterium]